MKINLTSEEILKLPKAEFIQYMKKTEEEKYNNMKDLGYPNYDTYNFDDKVNLWCEELNSVMRNQATSGLDEYLVFKPIWYITMKRLEPDFDLIIDEVFEKFKIYQWEWSKEKYLKRINEDSY
jgi:hypothetical protein